jgi:O-antigen ligase/Flp pilus assembly protein TadD
MHASAVTSPPCTAAGTAATTALRQSLFLAFFGFVLVALNCLVDNTAIDISLIPRLLAVLTFLLVSVVVVGVPRISRLLDFSVLAEPVIPLFAGYLLVTCGSLLVAANVSAGFTDVFRTLATFLTLCLSCLLLPIVPRWREQLLRVCVVAGLVGIGVGGYEIVTELGLGIHGRRAMEQITGLMSSVNLYAGILSLILPWCLCGMVLLRGAWRGLAAVAATAILVIILLLQSRAAWLAVLTGAAAAVGVLLLEPARFGLSRRARNGLAAACVGGLVALAGGLATAPADNVLAQRFRSIFVEHANPAALPREGGRLMIWGITSRMIADHPLTGVGAGNFTVRLHEYFGDEDLDFSNVHTNWVQPHNDFLWVFVEKGVLGIVLFVGCFVSALNSIRTILRSDAPPADRWLTLAALTGLVSYVTLSSFDFPLERINHQVSLALLLAVVAVLKHAVKPAAGGFTASGAARLGRLVVVPGVVAALGLGIAYSLAAIQQEKDVIVARRACAEGKWEEMLAAARRARTPWKTLDPLVSPVAFLEGMAHIQLGHVPEGIECLEQARIDNPNRMYVINNLGILYASTGRFDEAIECFSLAANRYPHRIEPFNNLASCLLETGNPAEAVELLEQIPEELRTDGIRRNLEQALAQAAAARDEPTDDSMPEAVDGPDDDAP